MANTAEIERAERDLDRALDAIRKDPKHGQGGENRYSQAYQRLVLLGARPQIRAKYRGR